MSQPIPAADDNGETAQQSIKPYWELRPGTAPIKSEYVLWDKMRNGSAIRDNDDDAAEGRMDVRNDRVVPQRTAEAEKQEQERAVDPTAAANGETVTATPGSDDQPAKKVRLSGAQKKHLARQKKEEQWQAKQAAKAADKEERAEGGETGGGRQSGKGQNKGRVFHHRAGEQSIKLCTYTGKGQQCERGASCKWSHDLAGFLQERPDDIQLGLPTSPDDLTPVMTDLVCPAFATLGQCPFGFKCRFGKSHMRHVGEGNGVLGSGWEIVVDHDKIERRKIEAGPSFDKISDKGEFNHITMEQIKAIRKSTSPLANAYLKSIGESDDFKAEQTAKHAKKRGRNGNSRQEEDAAAAAAAASAAPESAEQTVTKAEESAPIEDAQKMAVDGVPTVAPETAPAPSAAVGNGATLSASPGETASATGPSINPPKADIESAARSFVPDTARVRPAEKKRLDWRGKMYLAPLTTVGNEPFRRLCGDFGNDISCSEMGLAQEFLNGNGNEWSLVRRHPSEKTFGVQIAGSKPGVLVPTAEQIVKHCDIDFLDVNCGCPIDLVFNKGAGSALMQHAGKLGKALAGMSQVLGEVPLTIKIRTGVQTGQPVAHKMIPKFQKDWGLSAMTIHGRSRQQRYSKKADYAYIAECAKVLRETAADEGLAPIPIFGNGDAYDYRAYYENMEATGVDGIMIARGALIKPWIFTEIKERRDWDISSRERLDMVGKLVNYGLEHWGSDQMGVNHVRRFVCESLSFTHRYVPVGLLEHLPASMNDRSLPYRGRDELETLLSSDVSSDWVKITEMFLGPAPDDWSFLPKHKANASGNGDADAQG